MEIPTRIELPVIANDGRGNKHTLAKLIYVYETTCTVSASYSLTDVYTYAPNDNYHYELSCGHEVNWDTAEHPNYCPYCGAKVVE